MHRTKYVPTSRIYCDSMVATVRSILDLNQKVIPGSPALGGKMRLPCCPSQEFHFRLHHSVAALLTVLVALRRGGGRFFEIGTTWPAL